METKVSAKVRRGKGLLAAVLFASIFAFGGYWVGRRGFVAEFETNLPRVKIINQTVEEQVVDFSIFWEVLDLLEAKYLHQPLDPQVLLHGAISGLTNSLEDPYTAFLPPPQNEMLTQSLNGEYEGIGAELGIREMRLIIIAPLDGSPAEEAGVEAGDWIGAIEGESTTGLSLTEAVSKIRGRAGTTSTLTLKRGEEDPFDIEIERAKITIESVKFEDLGEGVGYLRLSRFGEKTGEEWSGAVSEMIKAIPGLRAVILDVRSNPGGFLNGSVFIASEFLSSGTIVSEEFGDGSRQTFSVSRRGSLTEVPVVVLINKGSASASEIVAAALHENKDARLVGATSFGKGTIQDARDLPDGSGIHITVAKWLTPRDNWIHEKGLTPDFEVEYTREDFEAGRDPQLDKALEIARSL
ncbi:S41 family peptidase [Candidatus Parcubacteria bacterium]|nr:S41 family peptidase [Candidatus Parcubacteria bacterium]